MGPIVWSKDWIPRLGPKIGAKVWYLGLVPRLIGIIGDGWVQWLGTMVGYQGWASRLGTKVWYQGWLTRKGTRVWS